MDTRDRARLTGLLAGLGLLAGSIVGAFSYYLFTGVMLWGAAAAMSGCGLSFTILGVLFPGNMQSVLENLQRRREDTGISLKILGATLVAFVLAVVALFSITLAVT